MTFIDQGEVEAMKTPIGCRAPRCDKDQFRANAPINGMPNLPLLGTGGARVGISTNQEWLILH